LTRPDSFTSQLEAGVIYRVDAAKAGAKPEAFFKCDEEHIRSLAWTPRQLDCRLRRVGLVYRIDPQGKGYVLFERQSARSLRLPWPPTEPSMRLAQRQEPQSAAAAARAGVAWPLSPSSSRDRCRRPTPASRTEGSEIYAIKEGRRRATFGPAKTRLFMRSPPAGRLAGTHRQSWASFRIANDGSYAT